MNEIVRNSSSNKSDLMFNIFDVDILDRNTKNQQTVPFGYRFDVLE